ncbi:MAG: cupin domain-containing protein [Saprospiraceae bacterium]
MKPINVISKFSQFNEKWSPRVIAKLNNQHVLLSKLEGPFIWHSHKDEDELFYVVKGSLSIEFRDCVETLGEGDMIVVPKGVDHRPVAQKECWVLLFEPIVTKHTGEVEHEKTVTKYHEI